MYKPNKLFLSQVALVMVLCHNSSNPQSKLCVFVRLYVGYALALVLQADTGHLTQVLGAKLGCFVRAFNCGAVSPAPDFCQSLYLLLLSERGRSVYNFIL